MSKRRVTAIVTLAGLLGVCLTGGCQTAGYRWCRHDDVHSGKASACGACQDSCVGTARIADGAGPPGIVHLKPAPAPGVTEPDAPAADVPMDEPRREPVVVDKPAPLDGEYAPSVTQSRPADLEPTNVEPAPARIAEPDPVLESVISEPIAIDVDPPTDPNAKAVPQADAIASLKDLGAVVKFDRNRDPFGDKETIDAVTGLDLSAARVTDADLKRLVEMKSLRELDLSEIPVSDAGLKEIQALTGLEILWLNGTKVTDAGLESVAGMTALKSLGLANTSIGDKGIERLAGLKNLEYLLLAQTQVTDAGLEHLRGMTNLKGLSLMGSRVTADGVKRLRDALPNCQVVYNTKKEQTSLPIFQRKPFGWFPGVMIAKHSDGASGGNRTASTNEAAEHGSTQETPRVDETQVADRERNAAIKAVLDDPHTLDAAGQFCISQGRWDDAVCILTVAIEGAPDDVFIRHHLAVALGRSGRIDAALQHFARSVGEAEAHYNAGVILFQAGNLEASEQQLVEALRIKPGLTVAREQLDEVRDELQVAGKPVRQSSYFQRMHFRR